MTAITAKKAQEKFFQLLSDVNDSSTPIIIVNDDESKNAVLVSESDWNSLQETLYLYSIPGMVESILEASKEPLDESVEDIVNLSNLTKNEIQLVKYYRKMGKTQKELLMKTAE